jgi:hypothetical protein
MAIATAAGDIARDVITELSQVPGLATQIYASGRILQFVQDAYSFEIVDQWWPDYMHYFNVAVDGTTGMLTQDLKGPISTINRYEDIAAVWPEWDNRRLRALPTGINPHTLVGKYQMMYMGPDATVEARPMKVWPRESVGNIIIWARQHSEIPMSVASKIWLDRLLMTYDAAWMYCVDDGTVPAQVQKYQMLAAKRRQQLLAMNAQQPIELDPRFPSFSDPSMGWFTVSNTPLA